MSRGGPVADGCTGRCAEEGSGTINSVGLIVVAVALAVVLGGVGVAHRERVRLQAVADLAALAGAEQSVM
ncbi:MAG: pilus assembly protein TadE, partial [Actinomyces sp.]